MADSRILFVEDDLKLASMVQEYLGQHGFDIQLEHNGSVAVRRIVQEVPDLVLLDLGLPGRDGLDICREVRPLYAGPILILTARGQPVDEVVGLELGADDYLAKPAHPRVLLARLRALLRRVSPLDAGAPGAGTPGAGMPGVNPQNRRRLGKLVLDSANRLVTWSEREIPLSSAEFDLIWHLSNASGRVVDREELYRQLRGIPYDGIDRSIDLRLSRVRRKLEEVGASPDIIKTVRGSGYLLVADP